MRDTTRRWLILGLTILAIVVLVLLFELGLVARQMQRDTHALLINANTFVTTANDAAKEVRDAGIQLNKAAATAVTAADEQRDYWNKTSLETYKTMASLRLAIVRTDGSINDDLVPRVTASIDSTNALSAAAAKDLTETTAELKPILDHLAQAAASAADTMADPKIRDTLAEVDGAASEANKTSQHVEGAAGDVQQWIHRNTTPVRGTWNLVKAFLREFAGPAAEVATAIK